MKKRVLLLWWEIDNRPELLKPFTEMAGDIEFIHLAYREKKERTGSISPFKMIYWFDFNSPYRLLKEIKPDLVIGNTETILPISLINACKKCKIPTYGLQHGFVADNLESLIPKVKRNMGDEIKKIFIHVRILKFFFSSFQLFRPKALIQALSFVKDYYKLNLAETIKKNGYPWLCPDSYICFSEYSSFHYRQLYNLQQSQVLYIGVVCYDELFKMVNRNAATANPGRGKYFLLIDTNFEEYKKPIKQDQINRCYLELIKFCQSQNASLKIKLHPWSYKNTNLLQHQSVTFFRNIDKETMNELILNAQGCFGFYSSLTMPIAFTIPTIQIKYDDVFDQELANYGITPVLDFYTFQVTDIRFNLFNDIDEALKTKFLFATDGNSVDRLKQILLH